MGGDIINLYGPVSNPTSNLTTSKLHWNSVISTPGSRYLVVDVKNFYLNNVMAKNEFYNIYISLIPKEVIDEYYITDKQIKGFLYVSVEKGMYGISQSGIIAHTGSMKIYDLSDMSLRQSLQDFGVTKRMESHLP